jgi:hypothetical protein
MPRGYTVPHRFRNTPGQPSAENGRGCTYCANSRRFICFVLREDSATAAARRNDCARTLTADAGPNSKCIRINHHIFTTCC